MSTPHATAARGLTSAGRSPSFQGRFGRMFGHLPAASFGPVDSIVEQNLNALGAAMTAKFEPLNEEPDEEESGIPALYTYLGQFIDHDITFDPASSLQKQNDLDALTDFRTPAFDLDNVYGRGPSDQPYMYDADGRFLTGEQLTGGNPGARDLPRNAPPSDLSSADKQNFSRRALIGDPRNDENSIISQLQGLFHRFHNNTIRDNPGMAFEEVQELVRFHYQYVVLNDFLPRIVSDTVLTRLKVNGHYDRAGLKFYRWRNDPYMPVEFAGAVYRLGHSMVRPGYRLNDNILLPIFPVPANSGDGLTGFRAMGSDRAIDWGRFIDIDARAYGGDGATFDAANKQRLQFAYRLDTSLVNPLGGLPAAIASNPSSLAARNLLRGWRLGLPSGQKVADAMGEARIDDKDIMLGKAIKGVKPNPATDPTVKNILDVSSAFEGNCPLWTYILAEAALHQSSVTLPVSGAATKIMSPRLGPVGGRIVAEVFVGMMLGDSTSLLKRAPHWQPKSGAGYALKDFVAYALS